MSKARSPCTVCSITIGINGLIEALRFCPPKHRLCLQASQEAAPVLALAAACSRARGRARSCWFRHLRLSILRLLAQELDGNGHELFSGAALVNARQLLCVRPAEEFRRLETGQASHVLHCDELEAGLPVPGHASWRVRDGPSLAAHGCRDRRGCTGALAASAQGRAQRGEGRDRR